MKGCVYKLAIGIVLSVFSILYSAEEPYVLIDSLKGKAEVQRAGQQRWALIGKDARLFNNDIIRVLDKSVVRLKWQNGSIIYVNASSQLLINLHKDTINNIFTNYATVFFGAVYFIVNKTLPKGVFTRQETRVYTPTAILAIRGTSFSVNVNKKNGFTRVGIINGTVLIKNILKTQSLFLSAGYQTKVAMNADPLFPEPLLEKEINALKAWVPPDVIIAEMSQQIAQAKADYSTITGKLEEKIVVVPFVNSSVYKGKWKLGENIASMLAENIKLKNRVKCSAVPLSKKEADPIQIGLKEKARFIITGEITRFEIIKRAEITAAADKYSELSIAKVCLRLQLIDAAAKKEIYKNDFCQEVSGKNIEGNSWKYIGKLKFDLSDQAFTSSILGKALNYTLDQSTSHLSRHMGFDLSKEPAKRE